MYIPNTIVSKVQKVAGQAKASIQGSILTFKGEDFKICNVTPNGIVVETIENNTQCERLFPFEDIA